MRIIERTNAVNKSVLYVVQEENYQNSMYNQISSLGYHKGTKYLDVRSFATLQEARDFMYQYTHNLMPGERVVT